MIPWGSLGVVRRLSRRSSGGGKQFLTAVVVRMIITIFIIPQKSSFNFG